MISQRYHASRAVGALLRGIAYLLMGSGVLGAVVGLTQPPGGLMGAAIGIALFLAGLFVLLSGELMRILIDIEENTRRGAWAAVLALEEENWSYFGLSKTKAGFEIDDEEVTSSEDVLECPECSAPVYESDESCEICGHNLRAPSRA